MKDDNCIFCKIASGIIPSTTLYDDDNFRVIMDLNPATRGHCLIIPKDHYKDLPSLPDETAALVMPLARRIGSAVMSGLSCKGFNLVQNNGEAAGQTVPHFHVHIIPRYGSADKVTLWKPGSSNAEDLKKACEEIGAAL